MQKFAIVRHGVSEEIGPRQNKQTLKYLVDLGGASQVMCPLHSTA